MNRSSKQFRFHKLSHSSYSAVSQKGRKCEAMAALQCAGSCMLASRLALTFESLMIASHTLLQAASQKGRVCSKGGCTASTCLKNAEGVCACCSMRLVVCCMTARRTRCFIVAQRVFCKAACSADRLILLNNSVSTLEGSEVRGIHSGRSSTRGHRWLAEARESRRWRMSALGFERVPLCLCGTQ